MFKWMSKEKADETVHSHSTSWTSNTKWVYTHSFVWKRQQGMEIITL